MIGTGHRGTPVLATVLAFLFFGIVAGCSDSTTTQPSQADADNANRDGPPADQQPENQPDEPTRREQMLVNREELEGMLDEADVRIVDTRAEDEYLTAHVPGAVWVDAGEWRTKALSDGGLEDREYWSQAIGNLGIDHDTKVVVYGGRSPTTAARIWWHLAYAGVDPVMLLDGGWNLWNVGGKPTEVEPNQPEPVEFTPQFDKSLLVTKEQLKEALTGGEADLVVVDTRSEGEYLGRDVRGPRGGHLPDAVHCEWSEMLDANGRFKSNEEIRQILALRDVQPEEKVVTHCQSGGRASLELFALRMAGFDNVANFYGGWSQWSEDPDAPVGGDGGR